MTGLEGALCWPPLPPFWQTCGSTDHHNYDDGDEDHPFRPHTMEQRPSTTTTTMMRPHSTATTVDVQNHRINVSGDNEEEDAPGTSSPSTPHPRRPANRTRRRCVVIQVNWERICSIQESVKRTIADCVHVAVEVLAATHVDQASVLRLSILTLCIHVIHSEMARILIHHAMSGSTQPTNYAAAFGQHHWAATSNYHHDVVAAWPCLEYTATSAACASNPNAWSLTHLDRHGRVATPSTAATTIPAGHHITLWMVWLIPFLTMVSSFSFFLMLLLKWHPTHVIVLAGLVSLFVVECLFPITVTVCIVLFLCHVISGVDAIIISASVLLVSAVSSWCIRTILYPSLGFG